MASIITDGPRTWAVDVLDHKLGRGLAVLAGANMLAAVHLLEPGNANTRLVCAVFAGLFLLFAVRPPRQPAPVTTEDLAELELLVMRKYDEYEALIVAARAEVIRQLGNVQEDVRVICDQLAD